MAAESAAESAGRTVTDAFGHLCDAEVLVATEQILRHRHARSKPDIVKPVFETNTFGVMAMTQAVLPQFRARRSGLVVNVTSSATLVPMPMVARLHYPAGADAVALAQLKRAEASKHDAANYSEAPTS